MDKAGGWVARRGAEGADIRRTWADGWQAGPALSPN
jgi:hypothetical protein